MVISSLPGLPTADALDVWCKDQSAATDKMLRDPQFEADRSAIETLLNDPVQQLSVTRRGDWIYSFLKTPENPRGIWQRVPDGTALTPNSDWVVVFDLDSFCAETGENWHWRGAETAWFNPNQVLLHLSLNGSDQIRHMEFDLATQTVPPNAFDLPASRSRVSWKDADTLIVADAMTDGCATRSGWPGTVRHVHRGMALSDAPVTLRADHQDLWANQASLPTKDGRLALMSYVMHAIGKESCALVDPDGSQHAIPMPNDTTCVANAQYAAWVVKETGDVPGSLVLWDKASGKTRTLFEPTKTASIENDSLHIVQRWLIWHQNDALAPSLWAFDLQSSASHPTRIALPENAETFSFRCFDASSEGGDGTLQVTLAGFLTPPTTYLVSFSNGLDAPDWTKLFSRTAAFDAPDHVVSLLWATSQDGTQVPYRLVAPKHADGPVPTLLYGYGGFSHSLQPYYSAAMGKLWLERGGAFIQAYIRGGSELGPDWHLQAKGAGRPRAYEDFVAIARDVVARGLTTSDHIACRGGSNGGLLCGVMLTRFPEDFGAVWGSVGVYDMLRFHQFPAGAGWMDEYGDPDDPKDAAWLTGYSPLHNIQANADRPYPAALIDTSSSDDRVDPSHSRWFARALSDAGQPVHYLEHGDGGHSGGGSSTAAATEMALGFAFLRQTIGAGAMPDTR